MTTGPTLRSPLRGAAATATAPFVAADRVAAEIPALRIPIWKRAIDIVGATLLLVLLLPLLAVAALAIVIDSAGGPLYRHTRVGRGGRYFTCWKFRSMRPDADVLRAGLMVENEAQGHIFKLRRDPRVTRVGRLLRKTSMDELPQLWNVLRGHMSLVGPRPPIPAEVERYEDRHYARLAGVPGLTGLWQVTARDSHDFEEMVGLDVAYLSTVSLRRDIGIVLRTIPTVLFARGSY